MRQRNYEPVELAHLPTEEKDNKTHHAEEDKDETWSTLKSLQLKTTAAPRWSARRPRPPTTTTTVLLIVQFSFLPRTTEEWNELPSEAAVADTLDT